MMVITCPGFSVHGGIRIILEWANRLNQYEPVTILTLGKEKRPTWFNIDLSIPITHKPDILKRADKLIICSPHQISLQDHPHRPEKSFIFMQMCEHLFNEKDVSWLRECMKFYKSPLPMMLISNWNYQWIREFGRTAPTYYIGNGVNLDDFPITQTKYFSDGKPDVLLESPIANNQAKDVYCIGLKVAERLMADGYKILSYGAAPPNGFKYSVNEYIQKPNIKQLNALYERSCVMIKATRYDARSTAPMEAMTKGCVTARAIKLGDDDLLHGVNCLRSDYEEEALYQNAKKLLTDHELRNQLSKNCIDYVQKFGWSYWLPQILSILNDEPLPHVQKYL